MRLQFSIRLFDAKLSLHAQFAFRRCSRLSLVPIHLFSLWRFFLPLKRLMGKNPFNGNSTSSGCPPIPERGTKQECATNPVHHLVPFFLFFSPFSSNRRRARVVATRHDWFLMLRFVKMFMLTCFSVSWLLLSK